MSLMYVRRWVVLLGLLSSGCGGSSGGVGDGGPDVMEADPGDADLEADAPEPHDADPDDAADVGDATQPDVGHTCGVADLEPLDLGWIDVDGVPASAMLEPCTMHQMSLAAAVGTVIEIEVTPRGLFPIVAAVTYPDAPRWDATIDLFTAEGFGAPSIHSVEVPRSGELRLLIRTTPAVSQRYDLAVRCVSGCDRETTRYPIVLVHGWTGFEEIGPLEYFYGVPDVLRERGFPVHVVVLDPYNSIEVRSEQLAPQIDAVLEEARATRVDIIAHSQGGLDSRRLISTLGYGDRVSALVTVATPHHGTPLCDVAMGVLPGGADEALYFLLELIGATVMGRESDAEASFRSLTTQYIEDEFNPANPDDDRVSYVSWTGRTCLYGIGCDDVCDVEIRWSYDLIFLLAGENDGIVPVSSAPWGDYRGEVPADHFDEVGQLFGVTGPSFDHLQFYLERARDLAAEGH